MTSRLALLKRVLSSPSITDGSIDSADNLRDGLIEALKDWPGTMLLCYEKIPFRKPLESDHRPFAEGLMSQLIDYFPSATKPYPQVHLDGFWMLAEANAI